MVPAGINTRPLYLFKINRRNTVSYLFDITHEQPLLRQKNIPGVQGNQVVAEKEGADEDGFINLCFDQIQIGDGSAIIFFWQKMLRGNLENPNGGEFTFMSNP